MSWMSWKKVPMVWMAAAGLALAPAAGPGAVAGAASAAGHWEGEIAVTPAENELDLAVDLTRRQDGSWEGKLLIPAVSFEPQELVNVVVQGSAVSFQDSGEGGLRSYHGALSADGDTIAGEYFKPDSKPVPFELHRAPAKGRSLALHPELRELTADGRELKAAFNRDAGQVRLLFILSPTSVWGNVRTRLTNKYLFDVIPDPELRVYVVWIAVRKPDTRKAAELATQHLPDPRAAHFWAADPSTANSFKGPLGIKEGTPWDLYLIYSRGARWGGAPPAPDDYEHELEQLPKDREFNAQRLAAKVKRCLAAPPGRASCSAP